MSLKPILDAIEDIASVSGRIEKEKLIKKYLTIPNFIRIIEYAYDPFKKFNTTRCEFIPNEYKNTTDDHIFGVLDYLASKNGATDSDILSLSEASSEDAETCELIRRLVNKDLRCGASLKTFKKFIDGLPEYGVMLCEDDLERFVAKECNGGDFSNVVWSEKLDGVRCTTYPIQATASAVYLSRNGREYPNFSVFDNDVQILYKELLKDPTLMRLGILPALDGEVIAIGKNKKEKKTFQKLMTQIRRLDNIDASRFQFNIFDIVIEDKRITLGNRLDILASAFAGVKDKLSIIKFVPHFICPDEWKTAADIQAFCDAQVDQLGWEGVVLKKLDSTYELKRSFNWCKVKKWHTLDAEILGWEHGTGRNSKVLGKFVCQMPNSDKIFECGSGLTDSDRVEFMLNVPELIEVKYQEITDDGVPRFPIFIRVREDK